MSPCTPRHASTTASPPRWRPLAYRTRGGPPEPAYVVIWRTPVMPTPAFWYFPGTPVGLRQAWAARAKLLRQGGESRPLLDVAET